MTDEGKARFSVADEVEQVAEALDEIVAAETIKEET